MSGELEVREVAMPPLAWKCLDTLTAGMPGTRLPSPDEVRSMVVEIGVLHVSEAILTGDRDGLAAELAAARQRVSDLVGE